MSFRLGKTNHPVISMECSSKHLIFAGPNALKAACFYIDKGYKGSKDDWYNYTPKFKRIMHYTGNDFRAGASKDEINGDGNHAKIYEFKGAVILSSQNNVSSGLFEFAIVYNEVKEKPKLKSFIDKVFESVYRYVQWF